MRELRNPIERAMLLSDGEWRTADAVPPPTTRASAAKTMELPADGVTLDALEREAGRAGVAPHGLQSD